MIFLVLFLLLFDRKTKQKNQRRICWRKTFIVLCVSRPKLNSKHALIPEMEMVFGGEWKHIELFKRIYIYRQRSSVQTITTLKSVISSSFTNAKKLKIVFLLNLLLLAVGIFSTWSDRFCARSNEWKLDSLFALFCQEKREEDKKFKSCACAIVHVRRQFCLFIYFAHTLCFHFYCEKWDRMRFVNCFCSASSAYK